jgi:hypothetical protein
MICRVHLNPGPGFNIENLRQALEAIAAMLAEVFIPDYVETSPSIGMVGSILAHDLQFLVW